MAKSIKITDVIIDDRIRADLGDIDALCNSVREFGLIQPVVLAKDEMGTPIMGVNIPCPRLVAGGRRLTALKRLGLTELIHGKHFIWRDEVIDGSPEIALKMQAIEIEENVRRKDLTWQEQVLGKKRLLEIMQKIHGVARVGGATRFERLTGAERTGFGVNKLAAMLGESPGSTTRDIQIAEAIEALPELKLADTKESAIRQLNIKATMVSMAKAASAAGVKIQDLNNNTAQAPWRLYEGDVRQELSQIINESVDLVYSDLPFGVDLSKMSKHAKGTLEYSDSRNSILDILRGVSRGAFRILRDNRFAVLWFGFNYYEELIGALIDAGFTVNPVPFIWFKNTRSTENPNTRYANSYDPALIAMKGSPVFIRPGQQNFVHIPPVIGQDKLQIAQQPLALVERFLTDMTVPGALVADLTAGSGTTGVAAVRNKRRVIMFEREAAACQLIKARMSVLK